MRVVPERSVVSVAGSAPDRSDQPRHLDTARADWYSTAADSEGLPYYLAILRSNLWFIALTTAICLGAALLYLFQAERVYEADADLLVTPVPRDNTTLIGLGLPRESSDPTRDVQTIARLIETPAVARRVVQRLQLDMSARGLLARIEASPVAQSNIVSITARADDPELAARIANTFGQLSVAYRTERMRDQIDVALPRLRSQLRQLPAGDRAGRDVLLERLRDLESLRALDDPTIRLETPAEPAAGAVSPRPMLTLGAALVVGLLLGAAGALGSQLFDPRLRREEQLRRYRVPILARVPAERRASKREVPLLPTTVSHATHDAYLLLAATLSVDENGPGAHRSVLLTGPTSGDGKTTSALNLAAAMSDGGRVVLVEADTRRPMLARTLGLEPPHGVAMALTRRIPLSEVLVAAPGMPRVQMMIQRPGDTSLSAVMTAASADWLIRQAHTLATQLVVDAPPLSMVPDALPLAKQVDDVILVVRLGNTKLKALEELAELLVQQGITPTGFVVVGGKSQTAYYGP